MFNSADHSSCTLPSLIALIMHPDVARERVLGYKVKSSYAHKQIADSH
jgi:hypothetical protein